MARERKPLSTTGRALAALALAWAAGYVDAAGYLLLLHVYTSHMTGNTAALAEGLAHGRIHDAALHAWPILAFVAGLMAGAVLTEAARRRHIHSRLALVLGCEMGLLAALMAWGGGGARDPLLWVGLPAMAMGMQTVTVTRVGDERIYTTYLTGMLSKFAEAVVSYGYTVAEMRRGARGGAGRRTWLRQAARHELLGHALLTGGIWVLFLAGALAGALAEMRWAMAAMAAPLALLAGLAGVDLRRPIAPAGPEEPAGFHL